MRFTGIVRKESERLTSGKTALHTERMEHIVIVSKISVMRHSLYHYALQILLLYYFM